MEATHVPSEFVMILAAYRHVEQTLVLHSNNALAPDGAIPGVGRKALDMEQLTLEQPFY